MADTKCPNCGGPASQPIMEIYCINNCNSKPADPYLFKWEDNTGNWWVCELVVESEMRPLEKFYFTHKAQIFAPTFNSFVHMGWISWIDGGPYKYEEWDINRVGWSAFNIYRVRTINE